ncbi:hypothetical protein QNI16_14345 [Cytophagaceae bacterium YF14B1]|uniref:Uncharacterized protein n=1 Tax=Xanthocytophaga flava TaxID=3048013 RepID=A0AAE3QLT0_9BACT|nr:hypothetical protein [Xanthocytophaga flavus]MDJ1481677.1 hypothetical protein [Xanthocytophaga flavus]
MLKIRAFRAIDDEIACLGFMEGHIRVLADYGITSISSNSSEWKDSASVYVVVAEKEDGTIVGGGRLHITDGIDILPMEKAVGDQDARLKDVLYSYPLGHTGELCGLWNARQIAGSGLSILLVRSLIAITNQIGLKSLFTFCSEYTIELGRRVGFQLESGVGDNGAFIYPGINYLGRVFRIPDIYTIETATEYDRTRIQELRMRPGQTCLEQGSKGEVQIDYDLLISGTVEVNKSDALLN